MLYLDKHCVWGEEKNGKLKEHLNIKKLTENEA